MDEYSANYDKPTEDLRVNEAMIQSILQAAGWAKFIAIMGFIAIGFMVLLAFIMLVFGSIFEGLGSGSPNMFAGPLLGILYLVIAGLYFLPVYFLYKYAVNSKSAVTSLSQTGLTGAFEDLRKMFKSMGIYIIAMIGLYIVVMILVFAGIAFASM